MSIDMECMQYAATNLKTRWSDRDMKMVAEDFPVEEGSLRLARGGSELVHRWLRVCVRV
jgi:hypothetical protein